MEVKEIMNTDVKTVGDETSIQEAAEVMTKYRIGCLIVISGNKLLGIITERDVLEKVVAKNLPASTTKVKVIMTKKVYMVEPDMEIAEAAELMIKQNIKKLPVVKGNKLIGIITATDICSVEPKMLEDLGKLLMIPGKRQMMAG